jgi:hypothetical protein
MVQALLLNPGPVRTLPESDGSIALVSMLQANPAVLSAWCG